MTTTMQAEGVTGPVAGWTAARWGGVGGFAFAASVVVQNLLRASAPANDARAAEIVRDYADHRALHWVLAVLFAVGALALAAFVAALWDRLRAGAGGMLVRVGVLGSAVVFALFSITVAIDVALTAYVHMAGASADVARGMWVLHNGVFTILEVGIAIALVGLAGAAASAGLLPKAWRTIAIVGAVALAVGPFAAPAATEGSPLIVVPLVGFLVWLVFVVCASYALVRE